MPTYELYFFHHIAKHRLSFLPRYDFFQNLGLFFNLSRNGAGADAETIRDSIMEPDTIS